MARLGMQVALGTSALLQELEVQISFSLSLSLYACLCLFSFFLLDLITNDHVKWVFHFYFLDLMLTFWAFSTLQIPCFVLVLCFLLLFLF